MSTATRQMHLGVFVLGTGNHSAGWRYEGAATSNNELSVIQEIGRIAERGRFDLLFISDGLVMDPGDHPSFLCRFEPTTLISVLSASTSHIGLGATVSTSFNEPYNVARIFASIDHISRGRAAWNVVTSSQTRAALNFSRDRHMDHELRYEVAQEFVDVVKGLWDCWDDDAVLADKATGQYVDAGKVRPLDHKGRFFQVKGPVNMARCPQGHPVIIQAGGSPSGLELAARTADVVFSVVQELAPARRAYADLKGRMPKYGRAPEAIAVLPGVMPIIGASDATMRAGSSPTGRTRARPRSRRTCTSRARSFRPRSTRRTGAGSRSRATSARSRIPRRSRWASTISSTASSSTPTWPRTRPASSPARRWRPTCNAWRRLRRAAVRPAWSWARSQDRRRRPW
jgi:FMN-dependent oxidoreductase (nitrilotriacetate monooxygenase family)